MKNLIFFLFVTSATAAVLPTLPSLSLPALPSTIPTFPIPNGPLTYMQTFNMVSGMYNSPIAKYLPPLTDMLSTALKVNAASKSVTEATTGIQSLLKKTMDNIMYSLGPSTTQAPSSLSNLFSNPFGRSLIPAPPKEVTSSAGNSIIPFTSQTSPRPGLASNVG